LILISNQAQRQNKKYYQVAATNLTSGVQNVFGQNAIEKYFEDAYDEWEAWSLPKIPLFLSELGPYASPNDFLA